MANFPEVKTGGWANGETITGAQQTALQVQNTKSVNGDEGSDHVGSCSFGGLKAAHWTDKVLDSGPHSGTPIAVTWDTNSYAKLHLQSTRDNATIGTITITMTGMVKGDRYVLEYEATHDPHDYSVVFASPTQHVFEDGSNEPYPTGAFNKWIGRAESTTLVRWSREHASS